MVDTNSDPREVVVIPSNDDASKSIDKILSLVTAAIVEGLSDRVLTKKLMQLKSSGGRKVATETAAPAATETAARLNTVTPATEE
jgi:small subunit ribosomal protein S2